MRPALLLLALAMSLAAPAAAQLSGTYTVGPLLGDDYTTIGAAVTDLQAVGMSGPTTIRLRGGTYDEQITLPAISGTSATNVLTIQALAGASVTWTASAASAVQNWILQLDGATHVDVRKLRFEAADPATAGRLLVLANGAGDLIIDDCTFDGGVTLASDDSRSLLYRDGISVPFSNVTVSNSSFEQGYRGIDFPASNAGVLSGGLVVSDNTFLGQYETSVRLLGVEDPIIEGNTFESNFNRTVTGIFLSAPRTTGVTGVGRIVGNTFKLEKGGGPGENVGIELRRASGLAGTPFLVANNLVAVFGTGILSSGAANDYVRYVHNTIQGARAGLLLEDSGTNTEILSNILMGGSPQGAGVPSAALNVIDPTDIANSDTNVFPKDRPLMAPICHWNGTNYNTLADCQAASGHDASTTSANVTFVDSDDLHLSVAFDQDLRLAVAPQPDVTTDVDGATRGTLFTYRGADVVTPFPNAVTSVSPASLALAAAPGATDPALVTITHDSGTDAVPYRMLPVTDLGVAVAAGLGATDYAVVDRTDLGRPDVDFIDIRSTGTLVPFSFSADDEEEDVALPFAFPFYDATYTSVRISTNGVLSVLPFTEDAFENTVLPDAAAPNGLIAPLWDDLRLGNTTQGFVYTELLSDGRFVVQWDDVERFGESTSSLTFQVLLSPDGTIEFEYETLSATDLESATIGIENADGTSGVQVAFDEAYLATSPTVRILPLAPWATLSAATGTVPVGGMAAVTLTASAVGLSDGSYTADLEVYTAEATNPRKVIPVTFMVAATGVQLSVQMALQGAYPGGSSDGTPDPMRTDLATAGLVPTSQPYASSAFDGTPLKYNGSESVSNIPPNAVDWILLELREAPAGATVARGAFLLATDGTLRTPTGSTVLPFASITPGTYNVVVRHRNHLALMSKAQSLLASTTAVSFTTAASVFGGSAAGVILEPGVLGLAAADGSLDGLVTAPDFNVYSSASASGATGYRIEDYTLDGLVTAPDFNLYNANAAAGAATAVPEN